MAIKVEDLKIVRQPKNPYFLTNIIYHVYFRGINSGSIVKFNKSNRSMEYGCAIYLYRYKYSEKYNTTCLLSIHSEYLKSKSLGGMRNKIRHFFNEYE